MSENESVSFESALDGLLARKKAEVLNELRVMQQHPPKVQGFFAGLARRFFNWDQRYIPSGPQPDWKKYADTLRMNIENQRMTPSWLSLPQDRMGLYDLYDELALYDTIAGILSAYASNATEPSPDTGKTVWVEGASDKISKEINKFFEDIEIEDWVEGLAYDLAKYGDDFARIHYEKGGGVYSVQWQDPRSIERVEDTEGILVGFLPVQIATSLQLLSTVDEEKLWQPWDILHFRLYKTKFYRVSDGANQGLYGGYNNIYGTSLLRDIRRVGKQLRFLDELLIIFRLSHAVDKHVFYVDVGEQSAYNDAKMQMQEWKRGTKRRDYLNPSTGELDALYDPVGINEDLYWPVRGKESSSRIEVRPGIPNVSEAVDVDYFNSKLHAGLGAPKEFSGFQGTGQYDPTKPLSAQSVRFAKEVKRLQKGMLKGITRLVDLHLYFRGIEPAEFYGKYQLKMTVPSTLEAMARLDAMQLRTSIAQTTLDLGTAFGANTGRWRLWVMKEIMGFSKLEIQDFYKGKDPNAPPDDGMGGDMGGDMGGAPTPDQVAEFTKTDALDGTSVKLVEETASGPSLRESLALSLYRRQPMTEEEVLRAKAAEGIEIVDLTKDTDDSGPPSGA